MRDAVYTAVFEDREKGPQAKECGPPPEAGKGWKNSHQHPSVRKPISQHHPKFQAQGARTMPYVITF